jgi:TldD protein
MPPGIPTVTDALAATDALFFSTLDRAAAERLTAEAARGAEDGELFLEHRESEAISLEDGRIRSASFDATRGFGLRSVAGEAAGYAHAAELSEAALARAAETVKAVAAGRSGSLDVAPRATNAQLYSELNPLSQMEFAAKTALLQEIDAYARAKDSRVKQVMASITGEWQAVQILRADGRRVADLAAAGALQRRRRGGANGRRETGSFGTGGRFAYDRVLGEGSWKARGRGAAPASVNLDSVPRRPARWRWCSARAGRHPAARGDRPWPRRATSTARRPAPSPGCSDQRIAAPGVTVVDDGTIPDRRGSLTWTTRARRPAARADRGRASWWASCRTGRTPG